MAGSGSLTQFLLDLTEDESLSARFQKDPGSVIAERGLSQHKDLLLDPDVAKLRAAVRAELGWPPVTPIQGVRQPNAVIAGVMTPGVREPPEGGPIQGVMKPPDKPTEGVMEPPPIEGVQEPPDEPIEGVQEPPDGPIPGVQEPGGPPESA